MPLGTLDRTPPPFFRQGASALSKLLVFSALSLFLMVADARFNLVVPLRTAVGASLYPLQWAVLQPVRWVEEVVQHFESLQSAQTAQARAQQQLIQQSLRAQQVEQLRLENERLRKLLALPEQLAAQAQAAQVLYDAADPYARKVVIDKGRLHGIELGSPVVDEVGVVGQVTRIYPSLSEVTLVSDPDQAIPVLNTRTGARAVAFGEAQAQGGLELRFMAANADVREGDLLSTSGVDGVYPPGLAVARVSKIERRGESGFAQIACTPLARVEGTMHVMVLRSVSSQVPARPEVEPEAATKKGGGKK